MLQCVYTWNRSKSASESFARNLSRYLRRVERGERLEVTERGKPVAVLGPVDESGSPLRKLVASGRARSSDGASWPIPRRSRRRTRGGAGMRENTPPATCAIGMLRPSSRGRDFPQFASDDSGLGLRARSHPEALHHRLRVLLPVPNGQRETSPALVPGQPGPRPEAG